MSRNASAPTMIIPAGTEIQTDAHGQLSVRTPGNLVIENSGHYGEIESVHGSIRIEANAEVEAVSVRCAETCYVRGSLTSWKVKARAIHLEESAKARIVLQETESLEIGKGAQLVGNFHSEKELFLLFSRFAQQLRSLPFYFDRKDGRDLGAVSRETPELPEPAPTPSPATVQDAPVLEAGKELPDRLFFALVLLERETHNDAYGSTSRRVLSELVKLLKDRDLETLRHTYRTLFGRIVEPGDDVLRAKDLIEKGYREAPLEGEQQP